MTRTRLRRALQILLAACAFFALTGGTAHADEQTLQVRVQDASQTKKVPVEGVHVVVTDPSGTVTTDRPVHAHNVGS